MEFEVLQPNRTRKLQIFGVRSCERLYAKRTTCPKVSREDRSSCKAPTVSLAWISTDEHKGSPLNDAFINVQSQDSRSDSPFGRQRFDYKSFQSEMIRPRMPVGIEY